MTNTTINFNAFRELATMIEKYNKLIAKGKTAKAEKIEKEATAIFENLEKNDYKTAQFIIWIYGNDYVL